MSEVSMNSPVEIEFAVTLGKDSPKPVQFGFLQVRPMVKVEGNVEIDYDKIDKDNIIFKTDKALGNGIYHLDRILYVRPENFTAAKTKQIAEEINTVNQKLLKDNKFYMLVGPGRWGSSDSWLGIPVDFSYITGAQIIVETQLPDMMVDPSQGSHFFQNMTSFKIAYFTIKLVGEKHPIDWEWLEKQPAAYESEFLRCIELEKEIEVRVDGQSGNGVALKRKLKMDNG
jgi:hypothetical protein